MAPVSRGAALRTDQGADGLREDNPGKDSPLSYSPSLTLSHLSPRPPGIVFTITLLSSKVDNAETVD
ncbi:hypothetical protein NPX13_g334 [Xylaria arbuscula]|uniref:Uncharacterized protein n=1 Tax=Xylaria arbuscula TaxID=114810 RepID=A0A9W8NNQ8_9PEZI|nr:hypothetical protein NPX13_g334 [Xylaria arbuscula]